MPSPFPLTPRDSVALRFSQLLRFFHNLVRTSEQCVRRQPREFLYGVVLLLLIPPAPCEFVQRATA